MGDGNDLSLSTPKMEDERVLLSSGPNIEGKVSGVGFLSSIFQIEDGRNRSRSIFGPKLEDP